ncbi:MAG: hypothetical protein CMC99_06015 [Flavobacteriales bacterium]|nr:hypothetical protein [Flavobacteriales bacterium]
MPWVSVAANATQIPMAMKFVMTLTIVLASLMNAASAMVLARFMTAVVRRLQQGIATAMAISLMP